MKQLIKNVLDDMKHSQTNMASDAAREYMAVLIATELKIKGTYSEYSEYELDEQTARKAWVCEICGKNTFELDYDYIGTGTNHLGCELNEEISSK